LFFSRRRIAFELPFLRSSAGSGTNQRLFKLWVCFLRWYVGCGDYCAGRGLGENQRSMDGILATRFDWLVLNSVPVSNVRVKDLGSVYYYCIVI